MITCPNCGCKFEIFETTSGDNIIFRTHCHCPACGLPVFRLGAEKTHLDHNKKK